MSCLLYLLYFLSHVSSFFDIISLSSITYEGCSWSNDAFVWWYITTIWNDLGYRTSNNQNRSFIQKAWKSYDNSEVCRNKKIHFVLIHNACSLLLIRWCVFCDVASQCIERKFFFIQNDQSGISYLVTESIYGRRPVVTKLLIQIHLPCCRKSQDVQQFSISRTILVNFEERSNNVYQSENIVHLQLDQKIICATIEQCKTL